MTKTILSSSTHYANVTGKYIHRLVKSAFKELSIFISLFTGYFSATSDNESESDEQLPAILNHLVPTKKT